MKTVALLLLAAAAHAQAPAARIKILLVFGNFAEHLGRIQGGAGDSPG
jgi:hypothetical protein